MLPPRSPSLSQLSYFPLLRSSVRVQQHRRCLHNSLVLHNVSQGPEENSVDHSASQKLFTDAANEDEAAPAVPSQHLARLLNEDINWTGEEPMEHAVLRMLVDKHKPLRTGTARTAEEKIRQASVKIVTSPSPIPTSIGSTTANPAPLWQNSSGDDEMPAELRAMAVKPLLQPIEGHRPWHTRYKAPSHAEASIRVGRFPPPSSSRSSTPTPVDERAAKIQKQTMKRQARVGRLTQARESMLDYRLGGKSSQYKSEGQQQQQPQQRPNPVSLRAWTSLIEDRIEQARKAGHFNQVKGRGKPIEKQVGESNPFIAREEFLMNRIVQRHGASPPWVEVQGEVESAAGTFREILKQSWQRRAMRILTMSTPASDLPFVDATRVAALRDPEWEAREQAYHDTALKDINDLVRKYNGLAPYAVRKPYYTREAELVRVYTESCEDILEQLADRLRNPSGLSGRSPYGAGHIEDPSTGLPPDGLPPLRLWETIMSWLKRFRAGG